MIWLVSILACAQETVVPIQESVALPAPSVWTVDTAMEPILEAMDRNGDGLIHSVEYQAVRGHSPGFREVDLNGNGVFELDELVDLVEHLDPQTWDEADPPRPLVVEAWRGRFSGAAPVRQLSEWMRFLRSELARREPEASLPTDEEIQAAAETGRHDSAEVQSIIHSLVPGASTFVE